MSLEPKRVEGAPPIPVWAKHLIDWAEIYDLEKRKQKNLEKTISEMTSKIKEMELDVARMDFLDIGGLARKQIDEVMALDEDKRIKETRDSMSTYKKEENGNTSGAKVALTFMQESLLKPKHLEERK